MVSQSADKFDFDVALSFAGEDRKYVEQVAGFLQEMGIRVFYDKYEEVTLWGKDLYVHLSSIYFERARYTVIFISKYYKEKLWTNHERESAQARAFQEKSEYILPARFDHTEIPGILPTKGYIDLLQNTPEEFAHIVKKKIGKIERYEYLPGKFDALHDFLEIEDEEETNFVDYLVYQIFDTLKLTTPNERYMLSIAAINACSGGLPENIHLRLNYLERLTSISRDEIISIFSRLECLSFSSKMYTRNEEKENSIIEDYEIIEFQLEYSTIEDDYNASGIFAAIFRCLYARQCEICAERSIDRLDFSELSSLTGFKGPHKH